MDNTHPQMVIELAALAHQERIARALAGYHPAATASRGSTPRAALALALVALATRLAPDTLDRRADVAV